MTLSPQRLEKAADEIERLFKNPSVVSLEEMARAVVSAYLGDTHVDVPREPTVEMLAAAFPCEANEEFSHEDKVLGAAVCLKLGDDADIGLLEGEAVKQAAFLARDYRLMLSSELTERDAG